MNQQAIWILQMIKAVFQGSPVQLKVLNFLEEDIEGGEDDQGCQECKGVHHLVP